MRIAIVGTGYIGLVAGICLSETGTQVCCIDDDENKINHLKNGHLSIYEPGLEVLFDHNFKNGRLKFTINMNQGFDGADIIFLTQPVPYRKDGSADLKYMLEVAEQIGRHITRYVVIAIKCSVPVGTAEKVRSSIFRHYQGPFDVISNPEFLCEGHAVECFMKAEQIIIGTNSERAKKVMKELYEPFVRHENPILFMDLHSAELTKYVANAFLATKNSFMNEVANLCEELDADINEVKKGMNSDERIGKHFLSRGTSDGESCLQKDIKALMHTAWKMNNELKILEAVSEVNANQHHYFLKKMLRHFDNLQGKHFAVWGIACKSETVDIREAPALSLIKLLLEKGATISAFDPVALPNVSKIMGDKIQLAGSFYDCLDNADALIITTEWDEFKTPDFDYMITLMNEPVIFDRCNLFELPLMEEKGFYYYSIGRSLVNQLNLVL